jgi:hypothetical protein
MDLPNFFYNLDHNPPNDTSHTHTQKKYFFNGCLPFFPFYLIDPIAFSSYSFETIKSGTFID